MKREARPDFPRSTGYLLTSAHLEDGSAYLTMTAHLWYRAYHAPLRSWTQAVKFRENGLPGEVPYALAGSRRRNLSPATGRGGGGGRPTPACYPVSINCLQPIGRIFGERLIRSALVILGFRWLPCGNEPFHRLALMGLRPLAGSADHRPAACLLTGAEARHIHEEAS
jgi:hypothetical protein